jgi:anaphase-promoting complex subunit 2
LSIAWSIGTMPGNHSPSERFRASSSYITEARGSVCPDIQTHRLGFALLSAYTTAFQTHLMSILPPTFARGFKALCASTLQQPGDIANTNMSVGNTIWAALETLGLVDRYESLIASVGYECIEAHVISTCSKKWTEPMLGGLRDWMTNRIVPWMLWPYARGASSSEIHIFFTRN